MRVFRVSLVVSVAASIILGIAGCAGVSSEPPAPIVISHPSEFLYVGTSRAGLVKYGITSDGSLHPSAVDSSIPAVCWPQLSAVSGQIYSLSRFCPFSPSQTELRRFTLGVEGEIVASTPPISLGPDLPSATGFALGFITGMDGKFGYARSIALDGTQHISPVEVSPAGDLSVRPDLGISWPFVDPISSGCSFDHMPDAVVQTANGPFLSVRHEIICAGDTGTTVVFGLYKIDGQTGAIGIGLGDPGTDRAAESAFAAYNGALFLTGETHLEPGFETGKLVLFRIDPSGSTFLNNPTTTVFLQACLPDQPACAHPDAGTFHPSGKWLFIADRQAGGIWTIPVTGDSFAPDRASFLPASLTGGMRFAFAFSGKYLYVAQESGTFAKIQGFQVDAATGMLTPLADSPKIINGVEAVTSMIDIVSKN